MTDKIDLKLFTLQLFRKWYLVIIGTILGAMIIGIPYVLVNVTFADPPKFRTTIIAHQTFESPDYYVNDYSWDELVRSDFFIEKTRENLTSGFSEEDIAACFSAGFESDIYLPHIFVTTETSEASKALAEACLPAVLAVKDEVSQMTEISILDVSAPEAVYPDVRVKRAVILGAVVGLLISLFLMFLYFILDDSVYVPLLFSEKYGIPMEIWDGESKGIEIKRDFPIYEASEDAVLLIHAGLHNGKLVDKVISEIEFNGGNVSKAYLVNPLNWIIKGYFATSKWPNPFVK